MSLTFDSPQNNNQAQSEEPVNPPARIMIVEDSEDIRVLLAELLEGEGYDLVFATNGEESLETAQAIHPDIILMDLSLMLEAFRTVWRTNVLVAEFLWGLDYLLSHNKEWM